MNVLITGDKGFVGENLKKFLKKKNKIKIITLDKKIKKKVSLNLKKQKINVLIHLAGIAHTNDTRKNIYFKNYSVTKILIESINKKHLNKIVFLSTSKINQISQYNKLDILKNFKDNYCESKVKAENFIKNYCTKNKINYSIIRPTLVYGKGVKGNLLSLAKVIKKGYPLPLKSFNTKKSYLSMTNLLNFIFEVLFNSKTNNKTFVISDRNPISLNDLIKKLYKLNNNNNLNFYFPKLIINFVLNILGRKELVISLNNDFIINYEIMSKNINWKPKNFSMNDLKKIYYE